jgi:hypothetical protein
MPRGDFVTAAEILLLLAVHTAEIPFCYRPFTRPHGMK